MASIEARLIAVAVIPGRRRLRPGPDSHLSEPCSLVCRVGQTGVQPAQLGLRAGLDDALRVDGLCGLAGFSIAEKDTGTPPGVDPQLAIDIRLCAIDSWKPV